MITIIRENNKLDLTSYGRYNKEWYVRGFNENDYCFEHYEKSLKAIASWCNLSVYKIKQLIRVDFT